MRQTLARIKAMHGCGEIVRPVATQPDECAQGGFGAKRKLIKPLSQLMRDGRHAAFGAAEWNAAELLPLLQELKACGAVEPASQFGNALGDLVLCFGNEFGCGRWRGRAQIGDE